MPDDNGNLTAEEEYGDSDTRINWFVNWGKTNGVKILFCLYNPPKSGQHDWNWASVRKIIQSSSNRIAFSKSVMEVVDRYNLDGVDVDFECNEDPDPQACNADSTDYRKFMQVMRDSLHKRNKVLTYAAFADEWNGPNTAWYGKLDTIVDAWASMGYDDDGYEEQYPEQLRAVPSRSMHKFAIGVPTLDSWKSHTAGEQLRWIRDNTQVGIAIWDVRLLDFTDDDSNPAPTFWNSGEAWYLANGIRERGNSSSSSPSSRSSSSSSSSSSSAIAVVTGEQVQNNTFSGTDSWNVRVKNGSTLSTTTDGSGLHVEIVTAGTADPALSVNQHDMTLVAGETYTFAFRMSASQEASVLAVVGLGSAPYTWYSDHVIDATDTLQVYTYTFVASETTTDARVVFEVSAEAGTVFNLQAVSMARGNVSLLPDYTPLSSSAETSSSGSTEIGDKAFALPGFRAGATVYGVTGQALLALPAAEWSSVEQVRDAIRGQLPSGVYLVKFDGVSKAAKIPVDR